MVNLRELTLTLPLYEEPELAPPFNYKFDHFTPILSLALEELPSIRQVQIVEFESDFRLTGETLLWIRGSPEPVIESWCLQLYGE